MAFHVNQARFERSGWRKRFLIPAWVAQTVMLLALMGIFAYRLAETIEHYEENDKKGKVPVVELVWECTNVGFSLLALLLTIIEISKLVTETLTPFFMLASHVLKITLSFAILALDIVVYTQRSEGQWSAAGLVIDVCLILSMLCLGVYSIFSYRRLLEYDDYHYPANVKAFGFRDGYNGIEMGGMPGSGPFVRASPYNDAPTEYVFRDVQGDKTSANKGPSETRSRAVSAASSSGPGRPGQNEPGLDRQRPALDNGRLGSYSHERDTQFDSFAAAPATRPLSKEEIDAAIGAALWGSGGEEVVHDHTHVEHTGVVRSDSVVGSGVVTSQTAEPHNERAGRIASWSAEPIGLGSARGSIASLGEVGGIAPIEEEDHSEEEDEGASADSDHGRSLLPTHHRTPSSNDGDHDGGDDVSHPHAYMP